jgi:phosphoglycolate phosphatase-like HAD superfamily hydrolase
MMTGRQEEQEQGRRRPLVVFDLVATLTDAGPRYAEAYIRMCRAWNVAPPAKQDILAALGNKSLKQIVAEFTPGLPADGVEQFMADCNTACDTLLYNVQWHEDLYPNVRECLETLHGAGYRLGVYTGTREDALASQLRYHNIARWFEPRFLQAKDNARDGALDSAALKAMQLEKITAAHGGRDIVVIGDSVSDYEAAAAAGLGFIAFAPTEAGRALWQRQPGIRAVFSDFSALPVLLGRERRSPAPARKPGPQRFGR